MRNYTHEHNQNKQGEISQQLNEANKPRHIHTYNGREME